MPAKGPGPAPRRPGQVPRAAWRLRGLFRCFGPAKPSRPRILGKPRALDRRQTPPLPAVRRSLPARLRRPAGCRQRLATPFRRPAPRAQRARTPPAPQPVQSARAVCRTPVRRQQVPAADCGDRSTPDRPSPGSQFRGPASAGEARIGPITESRSSETVCSTPSRRQPAPPPGRSSW